MTLSLDDVQPSTSGLVATLDGAGRWIYRLRLRGYPDKVLVLTGVPEEIEDGFRFQPFGLRIGAPEEDGP